MLALVAVALAFFVKFEERNEKRQSDHEVCLTFRRKASVPLTSEAKLEAIALALACDEGVKAIA